MGLVRKNCVQFRVCAAAVVTGEVRRFGRDGDAGTAQPALGAFGECRSLVQIFQCELQRLGGAEIAVTRDDKTGLDPLNRFVSFAEHGPHLFLGSKHEVVEGGERKTAKTYGNGERQQAADYKKSAVLELLAK